MGFNEYVKLLSVSDEGGIIMTRQEFLTELENSLEGKLPKDEISEILNDYNDIFDNSIYDGKTEESTSSELGSPAKIARKILEDTPVYIPEKESKFKAKNADTDTRNLASIPNRFAAFAIDTIIGAIILVVIMAAAYVPLLTQEQTTWSVDKGGSGYEAKFHKDRAGLTTNIEVLDSKGKKAFEGSSEEFSNFLDSKKLDISKDFSKRKYVTTVKMPFPSRIKFLIMLVAFGFSNLFNSFITWKLKGYTIGKKLLKIKVQKLDGSEISFIDALFRELIIKSFANVILGGLLNLGSFIWAALTNERNTIHDRAAKTVVVSVKG
jgi:uncharacterized RDD family membrane protein YckC